MKALTACLALTLLISGCGAFSKDYPDKRYFSLVIDRPGAPRPTQDTVALKVRTFEVSRAYEGQELIYRQGELDWASDFYSLLLVSPTDLVTDTTIKWLGQAKLFAQVVPQTSRLKATHYLEGYIESLYGDYSDPANPRAVVSIAFLAMDERELDTRVAYQRSFRREEPLADDSVEELIRAYERAFRGILADLEADLAAGLK
jgi:ABC-type uncharacterized transport system auxiliary subunit